MTQLRRRLGFGSLAVVALATAFPTFASAKIASTHIETKFTASATGGLKIVGHTTDGSVSESGPTVVVTVPFANLTTGIGLRDTHMKEYLGVAQYPDAKLEIARDALKLPKDGADASADVPGTLKLHGQSKPVTVHYQAKHDGSGYHVAGSFNVNMNDYGIETPSKFGVSVKPVVEVTVTIDATDS